MSEPFVGEIRMVGFNFAPTGWALCDGSVLEISQYATLFNLIGTTYGGNGSTTFALPDLRGRIPIHQGNNTGGIFEIGLSGGEETVTLITEQIPAHTHGLNVQSGGGNESSPAGNVWAASSLNQFSSGSPSGSMGAVLASIGGGQAHDNMPPFAVINFIISLFGVYPSQS